MIPLYIHHDSSEGEQGLVVIKFTQIYLYYSILYLITILGWWLIIITHLLSGMSHQVDGVSTRIPGFNFSFLFFFLVKVLSIHPGEALQ